MYSQATRIASKFGGVRRLAAAIGYDPVRVYKWTYARAKGGTGGLIPAASVAKIQTAAELNNITLTPEDWAPT